ncbi:MAG: MEDS domain-containing protein [Myxococcales bacterium]|jgi:hypothetical protein
MKNRQARPTSLEIELKPGSHASLLYTEPGVPSVALDYLAEGTRRGEVSAFLGYGRLNERVAAQLRDLYSVDLRSAQAEGRLVFLSGRENARLMRADLVKTFKGKRSRRAGRLLASLGWEEAGWPDDSELLQFESKLTETCEELGLSALCLYDARQLNGSLLFQGGLECHPTVFARCTHHKNPFFVEPALLQKELGARRRDESRLRAWMS